MQRDLIISVGSTFELSFVVTASDPVRATAIGATVETDTKHCLEKGDKVVACFQGAECPDGHNLGCTVVTQVIDTDSLQLVPSPQGQGFIAKAPELVSKKDGHGFYPVLSIGNQTSRKMLGIGAVTYGSDRILVDGCVNWEEGDRVILGDAFVSPGAKITAVYYKNGKSVVFVDRAAASTIGTGLCQFLEVLEKPPMQFFGTSDQCGGMWLGVLPSETQQFVSGSKWPYKLEIGWGWNYTRYNKRNRCNLPRSKAWSTLLGIGTAHFV